MKKEVSRLITIIVLLGFVIASLMTFVTYRSSKDYKESTHKDGYYIYEISCDMEAPMNYTIMVPVPFTVRGPMFNISELKVVFGIASIEYYNSDYGLSLKIEANGRVVIRGEKSTEALTRFSMSEEDILFNNTSFEGREILYWVNMAGEVKELHISIDCWERDYKIGYPHAHIRGVLFPGWQLIKGEYGIRRD